MKRALMSANSQLENLSSEKKPNKSMVVVAAPAKNDLIQPKVNVKSRIDM